MEEATISNKKDREAKGESDGVIALKPIKGSSITITWKEGSTKEEQADALNWVNALSTLASRSMPACVEGVIIKP